MADAYQNISSIILQAGDKYPSELGLTAELYKALKSGQDVGTRIEQNAAMLALMVMHWNRDYSKYVVGDYSFHGGAYNLPYMLLTDAAKIANLEPAIDAYCEALTSENSNIREHGASGIVGLVWAFKTAPWNYSNYNEFGIKTLIAEIAERKIDDSPFRYVIPVNYVLEMRLINAVGLTDINLFAFAFKDRRLTPEEALTIGDIVKYALRLEREQTLAPGSEAARHAKTRLLDMLRRTPTAQPQLVAGRQKCIGCEKQR